jgi:hypothetical protein
MLWRRGKYLRFAQRGRDEVAERDPLKGWEKSPRMVKGECTYPLRSGIVRGFPQGFIAGREGFWNFQIYSHSTRAGFHLRPKKISSGQSRFILFTICLPKVDTYFHKSERVNDSARNYICIAIINRSLWTTGGCPKRRGRVHQATNFVGPGPARRHENVIF